MIGQTLMEYEAPVPGPDGRAYAARACGRERDDGTWEGWLEFESDDELVFRAAGETAQPGKSDLLYWAAGLSAATLEDALGRALEPTRRVRIVEPAPPAFGGPTPALEVEVTGSDALAGASAGTSAIGSSTASDFDPFTAPSSDEATLRGRLGALASSRLRDIARAHRVVADPDEVARGELIDAIVSATRASKRASMR